MFDVGDVVRFHNPTAGKPKYHICLGKVQGTISFGFIFINSGSGYAGEYVFPDGEIKGLPTSPTGNTVVSFSYVIRMSEDKLKLFQAVKVSQVSRATASKLRNFAENTPVLTKADRRFVVCALTEIEGNSEL